MVDAESEWRNLGFASPILYHFLIPGMRFIGGPLIVPSFFDIGPLRILSDPMPAPNGLLCSGA